MKKRMPDDQSGMDLEPYLNCDGWAPAWEKGSKDSKTKGKDDKRNILEGLITNDIIPRLLLANPPELAIASAVVEDRAAKLIERVGELSELVVGRDGDTSSARLFEALRSEGYSIEALFQDLLAPTARRLGELWNEDIYDFVEVTAGLGTLQSLVRAYSHDLCQEAGSPISHRRALMMPVPGEQHTFGVSLLSEHFRKEGWRVWSGIPRGAQDLCDLVHTQWFDVAGLSASVLGDPAALASTIVDIRKSSKNPNLIVFVGGVAFAKAPQLVEAVGADATAADAGEAIRSVRKLLGTGNSGRLDHS